MGKKIYHANSKNKKMEWLLLILGKTNFITKNSTRERMGCFKIVIKWSIHQEVVINIKMYAPNKSVLKHGKQNLTELKGEIQDSIVLVGEFNVPPPIPQTVFSMMGRAWQKNQQGNRGFKLHFIKIGLHDIYRIFFLQQYQNIHS